MRSRTAQGIIEAAPAGVPDSFEQQPQQTVAIPLQAAGTTVDLGAVVHLVGGGQYTLTPVSARVESATGDYDSDGIANGAEVRFGLDPWNSADATQDPDGDGRTNAQEVVDGTDPFAIDSLANRVPAAGTAEGMSTFLGLLGNHYLELPGGTHLSTDFTWEFWAYLDGAGPVFTAGEASGSGHPGLAVEYDGTNLRFVVTTASSGTQSWLVPAPSLVWRHVALSYDGTRFRAYVDGLMQVDAAASGVVNYASNLTRFGTTVGGQTLPSGYLDEVRLWATVRSVRDLQLDMQRTLGGYETNLLGYWPLNEGAGTVVTSLGSGLNLDGTVTNGWANTPARPAVVWPTLTVPQGYTAITLDGLDLDGDALTWVLDGLPSNGTLFTTADGVTPDVAITSVPTTLALPASGGPRLIFEPTAGFLGTNSFAFHVEDGSTSSRPAVVTLTSAVDKQWTGATNDLWSEPNNWTPAGVPTGSDSVVIPGGLAAPIQLTANAAVDALSVGLGSVVDVGTYSLTLSSGLDNDGRVVGSGTVFFTGAPATLRGEVPNVEVAPGLVSLTGDTYATGNFDASGGLNVNGHSLRVDGTTDVANSVDMGGSTAEIDAEGDLTIGSSGCLASVELSAGTLRAAGDVSIFNNCGSNPAVGARLILDGTGQQFATNFNAPLRELIVLNEQGSVNLGSMTIAGDVTVASNASVSGFIVAIDGTLMVGDGAVMSLTTLSVGGVSRGAGAVVSTTNLTANAGGAVDEVTFTNLTLASAYAVTGQRTVPGNVRVENIGSLSVGAGATLDVQGNVTVNVGGALTVVGQVGIQQFLTVNGVLTQTAGLVDVNGNVSLSTNCANGGPGHVLTSGVMRAAGNFTSFSCAPGFDNFAAAAAYSIIFDGSATQTVRQFNDVSTGAGNHFGTIEVRNSPPGNVVIASTTTAVGDVIIDGQASIAAAGTLYVDQALSVTGSSTVTIDGALTVAPTGSCSLGGASFPNNQPSCP